MPVVSNTGDLPLRSAEDVVSAFSSFGKKAEYHVDDESSALFAHTQKPDEIRRAGEVLSFPEPGDDSVEDAKRQPIGAEILNIRIEELLSAAVDVVTLAKKLGVGSTPIGENLSKAISALLAAQEEINERVTREDKVEIQLVDVSVLGATPKHHRPTPPKRREQQ